MRRPFLFLVLGFIAGSLALAVFLTATGRLTLNRPAAPTQTSPTQTSPTQTSLPPLTPDVRDMSRAPAVTAAGPAPPDPSTFKPPITEAPLPALTRNDQTPASPPAASPSPPDPSTFAPPFAADLKILNSRPLGLPIAGLQRSNIQDTFYEKRGTDRIHEATDILAPRGTPVLAIDEGNVAKLFTSKQGGLTVYQFDNQGLYCYYYAHLDRYAEGLKEGMLLRKGDKVGYVGTTGNADPNTPHLHFAIFKLGPEKHYWQGTPIDPYPVLLHILGG